MNRFVLRHGEVFKNPSFYSPLGYPLTTKAAMQAMAKKHELTAKHANLEMVASSPQYRATQTAIFIGGREIVIYPVLDEVDTTEEEKLNLLHNNIVPQHLVDAGEELRDMPPDEEVIVSHGARIAGLCKVLGVRVERFLPVHLEIIELNF